MSDDNVDERVPASMKQRLQFISEGGWVVRYHTRSGIKPDTDAHHSHGVAMLCYLLWPGAGTPRAELLMAALTHDLAEQGPGDVSAPAKRTLGIRDLLAQKESELLRRYDLEFESRLTDEEMIVLKLADCFDGLLYVCHELALGNRNAMLIWRRYCAYINTLVYGVSHSTLPTALSSNIPLNIALKASVIYDGIKEIYHENTSQTGPDFDIFREGE